MVSASCTIVASSSILEVSKLRCIRRKWTVGNRYSQIDGMVFIATRAMRSEIRVGVGVITSRGSSRAVQGAHSMHCHNKAANLSLPLVI
jgi:hypothetical protein